MIWKQNDTKADIKAEWHKNRHKDRKTEQQNDTKTEQQTDIKTDRQIQVCFQFS
jgi:hypothetical protein